MIPGELFPAPGEIELNADEKKMFDHSVAAVKDLCAALDKQAA